MADSFQVLFGDGATAADAAFYDTLVGLEVEENADLPGALQLTVPIVAAGAAGAEDLSAVADDHYKPYARIAVVATPDGKSGACIFDGHVLAHKIHVDRGTTSATLRVWGQDVTCAMNVKEVAKEWPSDKSDGEIANDIFQNTYGHATASANTDDDSPKHQDRRHTLMQRATDAQFLRDLARRNGKLFRVCCDDRAGRNTGYFVKPKLDETPVATLTLNPAAEATVDALDFEWDVARPTHVFAHALVDTKDAESCDTQDARQGLLDDRSLADFIGLDKYKMDARLATRVDSGDELKLRAASLLREAAWFVKCEGEVDLSRLGTVLRVGKVVRINGAGKLHSGKYLVWSVRHTIGAHAHRMRFVLVRNAVGPR